MGGGLMQLVAYGAQDIYLTGNPQITFFKVVYRRHTNFSMEAIQQTVDGSSTIGTSSNSGTVTVSRNGDLVHNVYVRCNQDSTDGVSGDQLIDTVELEIGGQRIDKHTREWLQVWAELSTPDSKATGYKYLTGSFSNTLVTGGETNQQSIMVPLQFWFCRNPGLALPLIALQYHEVKMKFNWGTKSEVARDDGTITTGPTCEVWVDYIYLDTDERRRFAQQSHEYLIEQLQYVSGSANTKFDLNFNHPVKELIWTDADSVTTQKAKLTLNGHDRFAEQTREYFQVRQPMDHHTAVPGYNIKETENVTMLSTHLSVGTSSLTTANTYSDGVTDIDSGVVTLSSNNGETPKVGDIIKLSDSGTPQLLSTPVEGSVVTQVTDITETPATSVDEEIAIGGALASTTAAGTAMVATNHSTNVNGATTAAGMGFVIREAENSAAITFAVGDIIDVYHNDIDGDTTDASRTRRYEVTAATGLLTLDSATVQGVTVNKSMVTGNTHLGGDAAVAAGDKLVITLVARLQVNNIVGLSTVGSVTNSTSFSLSDTTIGIFENFHMHIVGRVQNSQSRCSQLSNNINVYSFALKPEEHQPSGTCNFSRIDNAQLNFSASATLANIYAVNYNVLRIMSGMGGLAYSN